VHSVLCLVANFLCVALLFLGLGAEFLAIIQVLVYAGGIVVLYLFVVMLVSLKGVPEGRGNPRRRAQLGLLMSAAVLAEISAILVYSARHPGKVPAPPGALQGGNTETIGTLLYTNYLVPFEVASMLLLVAMIGAILLAKKEI
jgi:NADH-quinone oxidoreductase subunit J